MTIGSDIEQLAEVAVPQVRAASWVFRVIIAVAVVVAIGGAFWWVFVRPAHLQQSAAQSKVEATMGNAPGDIATKALPVVNEAARQRVEVDVQVQKGTIDVRSQPDAATGIAGVSAAVLRGNCVHDDLYGADSACEPVHEDSAGLGPARPDTGRTAHPD